MVYEPEVTEDADKDGDTWENMRFFRNAHEVINGARVINSSSDFLRPIKCFLSFSRIVSDSHCFLIFTKFLSDLQAILRHGQISLIPIF